MKTVAWCRSTMTVAWQPAHSLPTLMRSSSTMATPCSLTVTVVGFGAWGRFGVGERFAGGLAAGVACQRLTAG